MQGLNITKSVKSSEIIAKARQNGLLILPCGKNDLRFLPPFIIEKKHILQMQERLRKTLKEFS